MALFRAVTLSLLVVSLSLSGCAIFRANDLPEVGALPAPSAATLKPAAGYAFFSSVAMGEKQPLNDDARVSDEAEFVTVLRESGYFATVEKESGKDMNIAVELLETVNPAALVVAFITGLSLYTIPSWVTFDYEVACKVTTTDGRSREYKLKDSATMVQWLPMLLVIPFKPLSEIPDLRRNIYKNLIIKMRQDGLLPSPGTPPKISGVLMGFEAFADSRGALTISRLKDKAMGKVIMPIPLKYISSGHFEPLP